VHNAPPDRRIRADEPAVAVEMHALPGSVLDCAFEPVPRADLPAQLSKVTLRRVICSAWPV
jgi:hypothetical protein